MIASSSPKWRARSRAVDSPTWRMPRPNRKRGSVVCLHFSSAASTFCATSRPCGPDCKCIQAEAVQVRHGADHLAFDQLVDQLFAETLDVHRAALREMQDRKLALRRAEQSAGAAVVDLAFLAHGLRAADGTVARHREDLRMRRRLSGTTATTSGITSPARRTITVSPMRTSLRRASSSLCKRGIGDRHAADENRLQLRHRRQLAGTADLDLDRRHGRELLLRRELVRDSPARFAGDEAEPPLQREAVDLVDHAVDVEGQGVALGGDRGVELHQSFSAMETTTRYSPLTGWPIAFKASSSAPCVDGTFQPFTSPRP